jgi:hypothetical protein
MISFVQAIPAAPAPLQMIFKSLISFPEILQALIKPARQTIAVPC